MTVRTTTVRTMPPVWMGSTTTRACAHLITQVTIEGDVLMPMCLWGRVGLRMSLREHGFLSDILEGGGRQREVPPPSTLSVVCPVPAPPTLEHTEALPPACGGGHPFLHVGGWAERCSHSWGFFSSRNLSPTRSSWSWECKTEQSPVPSQKRLRVRPRNMSLHGRKSRGQDGCETTAENLPGRRIHRRLPWEEFLWNVFPPTHHQNPTPLFPTSTSPHGDI